MAKKIYIADDEKNIRELIRLFLQNEGYEVFAFDSGDALLAAFTACPADMVILDIMMPGSDGLAVCTALRNISHIPIIIVSARDSELDRITGIALGSDDYMTKPFSPMELVARVKAIFRRMALDGASGQGESVLSFHGLVLNTQTRQVRCHDALLDLTPTEFAFLTYMLANGERAVSRDELLKNVWKFDFDADTRAADDMVKRLRKKLTAARSRVKIESVWGFGFKLSGETEDHE